MAVERNDINFLNNVSISTKNNKIEKDDVRSILFYTREFDIQPTNITDPEQVISLSVDGLTNESSFYKMIKSAFSQDREPVKIMIYGNKSAKNFGELYKAYREHELGSPVVNIATNLNLKDETSKTFHDTAVEYIKTQKKLIYYATLEKSKFDNINELLQIQTETNAKNVVYIVEGQKNVEKGNWLIGAMLGGIIGAKKLGSYIIHSSQIIGFVQENYTETEQLQFKEKGLNFLSKPIKNYFAIINGLASDNKTYIDLELSKIWLLDTIQKELTILQITNDKLGFKNDRGIELIRATILDVCNKGANSGIFLTDSSNNYFGIISSSTNKGTDIKLGYLQLAPLTQETLRDGIINMKLVLTYDGGIRQVVVEGTITTDGLLVV